MELLKADHHRKLHLAGVQNPVSRPVDIDQTQTGFARLCSLRIYRFDAGSVIDGHAEADEVLIVILAGSVQLTMSERDLEEGSPQFSLSAVDDSNEKPCVAFLPPNGAYRLIPLTDAEVAYARATTSKGHAPKVFSALKSPDKSGYQVLFEETTYPEHLRLRVAKVRSDRDSVTVSPVEEAESTCEGLIHVRTDPAQGAVTISASGTQPIPLESWDTMGVLPGDRATLQVARASSVLLLIVLASASSN